MAQGATPGILLVEDEEIDVLQFRRIARRNGIEETVMVASDGEDAIEALEAMESRHGLAPVVVVTDLNMPNMSGHEFIAEVRRRPAIANTVIMVITSSDQDTDIARAYAGNIAGYFVKDRDPNSIEACVEMLARYCKAVTLHRGH